MEAHSNIVLRELGEPVFIREGDWACLQLDEPVRMLEQSNIFRHSISGEFHILYPGSFVGEARFPGRTIRVDPRFPVVFQALRSVLLKYADRTVRLSSGLTLADELHETDPETTFIKALSEAIESGVPFAYEKTKVVTTNPRGRLIVSETIRRYAARSVEHLTVCSVPVRVHEPDIAQVLATTAHLVNMSVTLDLRQKAQLDLCIALLGPEAHTEARSAYAKCRELIGEFSEYPELADALRAALPILQFQTETISMYTPLPGGIARFVQPDRMWEVALTSSLELHASRPGITPRPHPYANGANTLFADGGPAIDPDIVIFDGASPLAVIDAKYKLTDTPLADDVYQLVCYADRLRARTGYLVYLSKKQSRVEKIGTTQSKAILYYVGVAASDVRAGLNTIAGTIMHDKIKPTARSDQSS